MKASALRVIDVPAEALRVGNVLIVEDEVIIRMIVSDGLRDCGYTVIEAMNGDEAVEILNSGVRVDLVFSDVRMPGTRDGLGLLRFVQANFPGLPVIITSGHLQPGLAQADGAAEFLAKPYHVDQAIKMIEGELVKRR